MTDAANLDGVWIGADEEEPVVANAQPKPFSSLEGFHVARAPIPQSDATRKECAMAVGLLRLRTSALAGSVHTIRFTSVPESGRSLSG
jgi:hypothetical protein